MCTAHIYTTSAACVTTLCRFYCEQKSRIWEYREHGGSFRDVYALSTDVVFQPRQTYVPSAEGYIQLSLLAPHGWADNTVAPSLSPFSSGYHYPIGTVLFVCIHCFQPHIHAAVVVAVAPLATPHTVVVAVAHIAFRKNTNPHTAAPSVLLSPY